MKVIQLLLPLQLLRYLVTATQRPLLNTDIPFNISESTGRIPNLVIKFKVRRNVSCVVVYAIVC